ncbi:hypothetical protein C9374_012628 [Naegleria lovaniensis]|uniref:SUI1 domain-containing protein n=1 Tax=Naegleria lovaniensis TaxID=51637 RepID=A0AA88KQD6_NAELO|nr:uncharacterized protein C9374_012628 [Naegleria lovaniensis]KAG2392376.1 hypothetical protein C9374_012628 [Naegleria lovaniensis]
MFKKSILKCTQAHLLKASDKKKLLKQLQDQYPNIPAPSSEVGSSELDHDDSQNINENVSSSLIENNINPWKVLLPLKTQNVQSCKLVAYLQSSEQQPVEEIVLAKNVPNKKKKQQQMQKQQLRASQDIQTFNVITVENIPMFFSIEKDEFYFPTIFALQLAPNLVDTIYISQPVSHYLLQGADLMKPGVSRNQKNQHLHLAGGEKLNNGGSHGGIGTFKKGDIRSIQVRGNPVPFAVGEMAMDQSEFSSTDKGKTLEVVHIFGDYLWQYGTNHAPSTYTPPYGFTSQIIEVTVTSDSGNISGSQETEATTIDTPNESTKKEEAGDENVLQEDTNDNDELEENEEPESSSTATDIKPEEMDQLLESYFISTLKSGIEDDQLPMEGSGFYTKMFEFSDDIVLDVKKSTYKKWTKFLKQMQKDNIVKVKDVKGTLFVTNVNRSHPKYVAAKELKRKAAASSSSGSSSKSVQIVTLKKSPTPLLPIFGGQQSKDKLFTEKEVKDSLLKYCQDAKIFNNGRVKIDELIYSKIFKSGKKMNVKMEEMVPVQNIMEHLLNEMIDHYAITYDGNEEETAIFKGTCPGITVEADKIMGTKVVTKVDGVSLVINNTDLNCVAFEELIKKLKNKCSASIKTNTSTLPTVGLREPDITIQGNHIAMVQQVLTQEYGFPSRYIFTTDKTAKKKKK